MRVISNNGVLFTLVLWAVTFSTVGKADKVDWVKMGELAAENGVTYSQVLRLLDNGGTIPQHENQSRRLFLPQTYDTEIYSRLDPPEMSLQVETDHAAGLLRLKLFRKDTYDLESHQVGGREYRPFVIYVNGKGVDLTNAGNEIDLPLPEKVFSIGIKWKDDYRGEYMKESAFFGKYDFTPKELHEFLSGYARTVNFRLAMDVVSKRLLDRIAGKSLDLAEENRLLRKIMGVKGMPSLRLLKSWGVPATLDNLHEIQSQIQLLKRAQAGIYREGKPWSAEQTILLTGTQGFRDIAGIKNDDKNWSIDTSLAGICDPKLAALASHRKKTAD